MILSGPFWPDLVLLGEQRDVTYYLHEVGSKTTVSFAVSLSVSGREFSEGRDFPTRGGSSPPRRDTLQMREITSVLSTRRHKLMTSASSKRRNTRSRRFSPVFVSLLRAILHRAQHQFRARWKARKRRAKA